MEASKALRGVKPEMKTWRSILMCLIWKLRKKNVLGIEWYYIRMNAVKAKAGVDSSEVWPGEYNYSALALLRKQQLEVPVVMKCWCMLVVSGKIEEVWDWKQEFQTAQNTLQMQRNIRNEHPEAQANVKAVVR